MMAAVLPSYRDPEVTALTAQMKSLVSQARILVTDIDATMVALDAAIERRQRVAETDKESEPQGDDRGDTDAPA